MVFADMFSRIKSCFQPNSRGWSIQRLLSIFFSFCLLFFCHPELSRQYFLKLQVIKTVLADKSIVAEHLAGYLFVSQAARTWLCKCCRQVLWADAVGWAWWGGWWLLKYHGQGPLPVCPDHPFISLWDFHQSDFICQEIFTWAVQHSLHPFAGISTYGSLSLNTFETAVFPVSPCHKIPGVPQHVQLYPTFSHLTVVLCAYLLTRDSPPV